MRKRLRRANISAHLEVRDKPTARAVSLVTHANRCIVADISAAADYTEDYFNSHFVDHVEKSQLFYQSAWFLLGQNGLRITLNMAQKLRKQNKTFMFNIGGEYICRNHLNKIEPVLPLADIIVGNSEDVKSLAEELKWQESRLDEIALRLSTVGEIEGTYKTVIITQGDHETVCAFNGQISTYKILPICQSDIVDTTAAGDSFCGGLLYILSTCDYFDTKTLEEAIQCGHWAAREIIKVAGCSPPRHCGYQMFLKGLTEQATIRRCG